ncbi:PREDICTED: non-specific lipid-transfer protein 3-like [Nelumbo nucifera]|uniref:Non-specific lipid-transfer protein 3-like n=1 Tax=Nelumbo nucifera TaxID=4432 RepID=A0A1U7ZX60_NELNU|nr:PREDICTED: non-specific lipid-transfer protein 3-like [Nelumbo nucifera]
MASKGIEIEIGLVVVLVVAMLSAGVSAQSSCLSVLVSMSPCLNYITGKTSLPSSTCCSQLALLGRSQPRCLCKILNSGGSPSGPNVNQTQALTLPSACNVPTPPFSGCNVATPTDTPVGTTPSIPSISAGGFQTIPSIGGSTSDASSTKLTLSMVSFFVASYLSTFTSL